MVNLILLTFLLQYKFNEKHHQNVKIKSCENLLVNIFSCEKTSYVAI